VHLPKCRFGHTMQERNPRTVRTNYHRRNLHRNYYNTYRRY
jgi:hypothetical protein